jgi:hypothetical protein
MLHSLQAGRQPFICSIRLLIKCKKSNKSPILRIYFAFVSCIFDFIFRRTGRVDRRTWGGGRRRPEVVGSDAPTAPGELGRQGYHSCSGHGAGQVGPAVSRRKSPQCGRRKAALLLLPLAAFRCRRSLMLGFFSPGEVTRAACNHRPACRQRRPNQRPLQALAAWIFGPVGAAGLPWQPGCADPAPGLADRTGSAPSPANWPSLQWVADCS